MPQITKGLRLTPNGNVRILYGTGDPNATIDQDVNSAGVGSLYLRRDGSTSTSLYVCTGTQTVANVGVNVALWTAK
jgi:hypothetical protein